MKSGLVILFSDGGVTADNALSESIIFHAFSLTQTLEKLRLQPRIALLTIFDIRGSRKEKEIYVLLRTVLGSGIAEERTFLTDFAQETVFLQTNWWQMVPPCWSPLELDHHINGTFTLKCSRRSLDAICCAAASLPAHLKSVSALRVGDSLCSSVWAQITPSASAVWLRLTTKCGSSQTPSLLSMWPGLLVAMGAHLFDWSMHGALGPSTRSAVSTVSINDIWLHKQCIVVSVWLFLVPLAFLQGLAKWPCFPYFTNVQFFLLLSRSL